MKSLSPHDFYESLIDHKTSLLETRAELKRKQLERFAQVFGRVNSVLTMRPINVKVEASDFSAPAWSGSREVFFNSNMIGELNNARTIASVKGLNLHEVGHILYSPRNGTQFVNWVQENNVWQAFNALEDCRIETLMVGRFPSVINWLTATILEQLMDNAGAMQVAYPLVAGRRYLPVELRQLARSFYVKQSDVDELSEITNAYRQLVFPTDSEIAKDLITRFSNLTHDLNQHADSDLGSADPCGHDSRPTQGIESSTSRPATARDQRNALNRAKQFDKGDDSKPNAKLPKPAKQNSNADQFGDDDDDDDDDLADDLGNQLSDQSSDNVADDSTASSKSQPDNSDTQSDSDSDDTSAGNQDSDPVETALDNMLQDVLNNADVQAEINDLMRQLQGLPSLQTNSAQKPERANYRDVPVDSATVASARSFGRELERLRANSDPAWDKKLSSGKLNARRVMRGDSLDSVFDQWNMGRADATEIECVVLLDTSGSMHGENATLAYQSMYAIKHALDRINANTTVIGFSNEARLLYDKTDKAGFTIRDGGSGGGTEPYHAIQYATKLFAETDKPVKLLFVITDGEWQGSYFTGVSVDECDNAIKKLRMSGVLTALAFIDSRTDVSVTSHNCEIKLHVQSPQHLTSLARSLVKLAIARRLTNS